MCRPCARRKHESAPTRPRAAASHANCRAAAWRPRTCDWSEARRPASGDSAARRYRAAATLAGIRSHSAASSPALRSAASHAQSKRLHRRRKGRCKRERCALAKNYRCRNLTIVMKNIIGLVVLAVACVALVIALRKRQAAVPEEPPAPGQVIDGKASKVE